MAEDKRIKVKKGWLAVRVEDRRFVIPISNLYHPLFKNLLESAQEVYGYQSSGPLQLPCSVEDFISSGSSSGSRGASLSPTSINITAPPSRYALAKRRKSYFGWLMVRRKVDDVENERVRFVRPS